MHRTAVLLRFLKNKTRPNREGILDSYHARQDRKRRVFLDGRREQEGFISEQEEIQKRLQERSLEQRRRLQQVVVRRGLVKAVNLSCAFAFGFAFCGMASEWLRNSEESGVDEGMRQ